MKNRLGYIMVFMLLLTVFAGCGKQAQKTDTQKTDTQQQNQNQFQNADVMGQVESIANGVITLKVAKQPEMNQKQNGNQQNNDAKSSASPKNESGNGNEGQKKSQNGNGNGNAAPPQAPNGGENGGAGGMGRALEFTGETVSITLTDSTTVQQFSRDQEQKQLTTQDIKAGDTVMVWYENKDEKTAARVNLMGMQEKPAQTAGT